MRGIGRILLSLSETPKRVWLVILTELFILAALKLAGSEVGGKMYDLGHVHGDYGSRFLALWHAENVLLDVFLVAFFSVCIFNVAVVIAQAVKFWTTARRERRDVSYMFLPFALEFGYLALFGFILHWSPGVQTFHRWQAGVVLALLIAVAVFWRAKPTPRAATPPKT